jgi:Cu2+-exporting ATPase
MPILLPLAVAGSAIASGFQTIRKHLIHDPAARRKNAGQETVASQPQHQADLANSLNAVSAEVAALSTAVYKHGQQRVAAYQRRQVPLVDLLRQDAEPTKLNLPRPTKRAWPFIDELIEELDIVHSPTYQAVAEVGAHVDKVYQRLVVEYIDPLFGSERYQQFQLLATGDNVIEISDYEKELNRNIAMTTLTLGTALLGTLLAPIFYLPTVALAIYLTRIPVGRAYHALFKERRIKLPVLVTLNIVGMWLGGYFVVGALGFMIFFIGEKLVIITQDRSHKNLINVFGQQPRTVWVLVNDTEVEIPFEQLQPGDQVQIHAGQTIPIDGVIVAGMATIDQHALTGEAQPAEKGIGDRVLTATTVLGGKIIVEVEQTGVATVAAQIGDILNTTTGYQMAIESKGLTLAHELSLPTLMLGLLAWPVASYQAMVAILGCSIGYNIKITGPIGMLNFLNVASRQGILVKDGRSLELMAEIDTVVFDKTGTLTLEQPQVVAVHTCGLLDPDILLTYAAAAEQRQPHPIARAIVEAAAQRGLQLPTIEEARYQVGYGIRVQIDDHVIYIGSDRYMTLEGLDIPLAMQERKEQCHAEGHSLIMVAVDEELAGAIELQPTLRPEAKAIIADLRRRGLDLVIISGDQEQPTRKLAQELGITRYFANTLPENKALHVEKLQSEGRAVCFVGDGINDAIALKTANVSISLRGATTAATDTAQVVLMGANLTQLPLLFTLGDEFYANMRQGFNAAIVPGVLTIGGAYLGIVGIAGSLAIWIGSLLVGLRIAAQPLLIAQTPPRSETTEGAQPTQLLEGTTHDN